MAPKGPTSKEYLAPFGMYIQSPAVNSFSLYVIDPLAMNRMPLPSSWACSGTFAFGEATEMNTKQRERSMGSCHFEKPLGILCVANSFQSWVASRSREVTICLSMSKPTFRRASLTRLAQASIFSRFG